MFDSAIWEVGIGLTFIYLVLSLVCTTVNERLSVYLALRSKTLKEGVGHLLRDPEVTGLARDVLDHELVQALGKKGDDGLSDTPWIPAETFRVALTDVLERRLVKAGVSTEELDAALAAAPEGASARLDALVQRLEGQVDEGVTGSLRALRRAASDLEDFEKRVCGWYDDTMDRVTDWYVRRIQRWILAIAALVAISLNADTLMMAEELYNDPGSREAIAAQAREIAESDEVARTVDSLREDATPASGDAASTSAATSADDVWKPLAESLSLPFGWTKDRARALLPTAHPSLLDWLLTWLSKLLGLAVTTVALSQGAPFWFDFLRKVAGRGGKKSA